MNFDVHEARMIEDDLDLGKDADGSYYTIEEGTPVYIGTDGNSEDDKVVPITDVSEQRFYGFTRTTTAFATKNKGKVSVIIDPAIISTDKVVESPYESVPVVGSIVYLNDDGKLDADNGDSAPYSVGTVRPSVKEGCVTIKFQINYAG